MYFATECGWNQGGTNDYLNELNSLGCREFDGCQQGETPCSAIRR